MALRTAFRPDAAAALPAADYELHVGDVALRVQVDGDALRDRPARARRRRPSGGRLPAGEPDLVFAAGPGIRRVISGELTPAEAIDQGVVSVVSRRRDAARAVRRDVPHRPGGRFRARRVKGDAHDRSHPHRPVHDPRRRRPGARRPRRGPRGGLPLRRLAGAPHRRGRRPLDRRRDRRDGRPRARPARRTTSSRRTGRTTPDRHPRSPGSSTRSRSTSPPAARSSSTGRARRSSDRMPRPRSPRCASGTRTST